MNHELWYTSAPRGLASGSSGFCTVKATSGLPLPLRELLESLSQYRNLYPPNDPRAATNPVNFSFVQASVAGRKWQILSRVQAAGLDHTQRTNFFAHHIAIEQGTPLPADPTWLFQRGALAEAWDFRTEELPACRGLPAGRELLRPCLSWQAVTGDSGWAGAVAERVAAGDRVFLTFAAGCPTLPLLSEMLALLPAERRDKATFSTYCCNLPQGVECQVRCVAAGSPEARSAAGRNAAVFDLTAMPGRPDESPWVETARTGTREVRAQPAAAANAGNRAWASEPVENAVAWRDEVSHAKGGSRAAPAAPRPAHRGPPLEYAPAATTHPPREGGVKWAPIGAIGGILLATIVLVPLWLSARSQTRVKQSEMDELAQQLSGVQAALTGEKQRAVGLEVELRHEREQRATDTERHQQEIGRKENTKQGLGEDLDATERDLAAEKEAHKQTEARLREVELDNAGLVESNKQLAADVARLRASTAELEERPAAGDRPKPAAPEFVSLLPAPYDALTDQVNSKRQKLAEFTSVPTAISLKGVPDHLAIERENVLRYKVRWDGKEVASIYVKDQIVSFVWTASMTVLKDVDLEIVEAALRKGSLVIAFAVGEPEELPLSKQKL